MMAGKKYNLGPCPITWPYPDSPIVGSASGWEQKGPCGAKEDGWCQGENPARSIPTMLTESTSCLLPLTDTVGPAKVKSGGKLDWDLGFTSCAVWGVIIKNI